MTSSEKDRRKALRDSYKAQQKQDEWESLGLDRDQLDALLEHLEDRLSDQDCDHSLRHTQAWVNSTGLDWDTVKSGLASAGGYCDCEVLANVDPDDKV
ncbi:DUF2695 domain-containing protein [Kitasatospora sp. NPDC008050]|uniref:DUF2695 domain-containing protein n=1 Tax=Kitasatospora sp. NPDC008050 TaxID=3364021 RepID=UPI0036F0F5CC